MQDVFQSRREHEQRQGHEHEHWHGHEQYGGTAWESVAGETEAD